MQEHEQKKTALEIKDDAETVRLFECLARKLLKRSLDSRRRFLAKFEKQHGEIVTDKIKLYLSKEHNKIVAARNAAMDAAQKAREELKCLK